MHDFRTSKLTVFIMGSAREEGVKLRNLIIITFSCPVAYQVHSQIVKNTYFACWEYN